MSERRYNEAEVAAIFERASESPHAGARHGAPAEAGGMTLAELQEIGRDVGIPAESIALAASSVGQPEASASRRFMGLPFGVSRTVQLERRLSEEEWERVVVDLRETFDARGNVRSQGSLRQWTNGNLQALLEPTATGHRIRMRTVKGDAVGTLALGLGTLVVGVALLIAALVRGALDDRGMVMALTFLIVASLAMLASSALRLPRWAATRRRQMEEVAARAALIAAAPPSLPPSPAPSSSPSLPPSAD